MLGAGELICTKLDQNRRSADVREVLGERDYVVKVLRKIQTKNT